MPELSTGLRTFAAEDPGSWDSLVETAQLLDAVGFDRVVVSDHVVFGEALDDYARPERGGVEGGRQPTGPDGHWLEPLTTLAYLAAATSRIRLGTNILIAALRRPVVLAKTAATIDVLSGGRLDLGVGVGWQDAEYAAAGLDYHRRGRLLDESLELCQALWRDPVVDLPGAGPIHMMPKPRQPGGVPIWVSGRINPNVVRRLARFGSGWIPWGDDAADPATAIPRMRAAVTDAGGDPAALQVVGTLRMARDDAGHVDVATSVARVPALVDAGVTDVRVQLRPDDLDRARLEQLVAGFRESATGTVRP